MLAKPLIHAISLFAATIFGFVCGSGPFVCTQPTLSIDSFGSAPSAAVGPRAFMRANPRGLRFSTAFEPALRQKRLKKLLDGTPEKTDNIMMSLRYSQ